MFIIKWKQLFYKPKIYGGKRWEPVVRPGMRDTHKSQEPDKFRIVLVFLQQHLYIEYFG